ncbi:unnamed protein product [Ectocarpus sp. 12 AP-2014]
MGGGLRQGRAKLLRAGTRRASLQPRFWVYMRRGSRKAPPCKTMMRGSPVARDPSLLHRSIRSGVTWLIAAAGWISCAKW